MRHEVHYAFNICLMSLQNSNLLIISVYWYSVRKKNLTIYLTFQSLTVPYKT